MSKGENSKDPFAESVDVEVIYKKVRKAAGFISRIPPFSSLPQADIEDGVQEAVIKISIKVHGDSIPPDALPSDFYNKVVKNVLYDITRRKKRQSCCIEQLKRKLLITTSSETNSRLSFQLSIAIQELPDVYRTIIIRRYFYNYTLREIATELELGDKIYRRHTQALELLSERL